MVALAPEQAQNSNPSPGASAHPGDDASPPKSLRPDDPVITVRGLCKGKESSAAAVKTPDCKTIVTREQFERLAAAVAIVGQPVPLNGRRQLAQTYVDLLAYEKAARPAKTESSPEFQDLMELIRLRTLAEIHRRNLQARFQTPTAQEIDDYYRQNLSNFIDMRLSRILIPRKNPSAVNQEEYEKLALGVANELRERAAKGEDFDQLQKEGYKALGLASAPGTNMGNRRKTNLLPENRDEILGLSEGGVSKVEPETFGFVIYKVGAKALLPKETVKDEIAREISRQRLENAVKEITADVVPEFNQEYFPATPSPAPNTPSSPAGVQQPSSRVHQ
jgi:hypothetical protein